MKRNIRRLKSYDESGYPSLSDHRQQRRRFLQGGAVLVGGGALTACSRPFGRWLEDDPPEVDGGMDQPSYYQVRIPETGDRSVYLMDGGYARYYAVALTYTQDCAFFATDARDTLGQRFDALIGERSYDELVTADAATLDALREDLRADLDAAYNEDTGDLGESWFTAVELTFVRLDAPELMGGVPRAEPSYP